MEIQSPDHTGVFFSQEVEVGTVSVVKSPLSLSPMTSSSTAGLCASSVVFALCLLLLESDLHRTQTYSLGKCEFPSPSTEEEQRKEKELINRETESRCVELVTSLSHPVRANHVNWGDDPHRQQLHNPLAPPPSSLPPPQVPIAVIPMVPVVTATPSVPSLPLTTQIAAAATTISSPPPAKNAPSQQQPPLPPPPPASHHLLCSPQMKLETSPKLVKPNQSQPQVQIQYPNSISTNGSSSQHALAPHQAPPASQLRPNGVTVEEMRGMEGKRRPGGSVCICGRCGVMSSNRACVWTDYVSDVFAERGPGRCTTNWRRTGELGLHGRLFCFGDDQISVRRVLYPTTIIDLPCK